ncbi:hypothetical protein HELRODRAFT_166938 [Helobdella robusta]|uniref:Uncharacterized protein n=1 Tax=Helobdella robusta TaxID=6412 RepID=T1EYS1_HELRO|nr:hypothetical protein HELRODRAFT_166938 [Helobdella robusta]ESO11862.1 hypothetical protein HELRODRAFT_166938 [Helobdella robusta]
MQNIETAVAEVQQQQSTKKFERNEEQFDDKSITAFSESELSSASSCQNIEDSLVCLRNDEKTSGVRNKMLLKKLRDGFKHEERYLTKREQMLKDRKAKALELLKRSKKLDEEEEEVKKLHDVTICIILLRQNRKKKEESFRVLPTIGNKYSTTCSWYPSH